MGFMKVSHIFIYILLISLFSAPVSADFIIENTSTANISDNDVWSSAISPDGRTIAYVSYDNSGNQQIFTIKIDGSKRKQLTTDPNKKWGVEWLTNEISYVSYDTDDIEKIFIVSLDGSERRKLINETIRQGREPAGSNRFWGAGSWDPENKKILFTSLGKMGDEKIFIVNIDGTGKKQLINDSSRQWNPRWSPDGNSFIFISQDNKSIDQLYMAKADGTDINQITEDGFKKSDINWGRGGILFVSTETQIASSVKIFVVNPDGSGKRRLIDQGYDQENPRWSRDGDTILYEDIDITGNKLIKLLSLKKPETISAVSPVIPTVTRTSTPTVTPAATETPVIEKTPTESSLEGTVLSLVLILGLIVLIMLAILWISNFMSKKK
jgi:TolB protein